ncbi:nuclear receptor 2C2-associated protein-like isoform X2 [Acipenser ruthenus]|uniref:nuclear receptor 2C2-associated protein-like isoform X2 n=1 Tax=Acipenser ruthenus TaxID=7906 RepID=UPI00145BD244|nr:nuclear receptor 2C2-associated protein-like isoform X2 [Acipenser ruthenus]
MAVSLICSETVSRVSSVLNRDVKQFGKKHMFDSNEETCWNSDQGATQWVLLEFPQEVRVSEVRVQFQGGFTGNTCRIEGCQKDEAFTKLADFYPEDKNSLQSFPIHGGALVRRVKIVFENSTDFFGRVIVYTLDVLGDKV